MSHSQLSVTFPVSHVRYIPGNPAPSRIAESSSSDSSKSSSGPSLLAPSQPPKSVRPCQWSKDCVYLLVADNNAIRHHLVHVHGVLEDSISLCCVWDQCTKVHASDLTSVVRHIHECHLHIEEVQCLACGYPIDKVLYRNHMDKMHPAASRSRKM